MTERTAPTRRAEQQDVRAYAERLLQALRHWETRVVDLPATTTGRATASRYQVIACGQYGSHSSSGGRAAQVTYLQMPGPRPYTASEVAASITQLSRSRSHDHAEHGRRLEAIRAGNGPATLLRDRGWAAPTTWSVPYALALLTLAVQLGDPAADTHLANLRRAYPIL